MLRVVCLTALVSCVGQGRDAEPAGTGPGDAAGVAPIVQRAEVAVSRGDLDAAIDAYREAWERTPWNTRLQRSLVATYARRAGVRRVKPGGEAGLASAEADLREALAIAPGDPELERSLAAVLLERASFARDDAESARLREEAAALAPDLVAAAPVRRLPAERRLDLAYDLLQRGQLDAGIDQLQALLRDYPKSDEGARLLAQALVRKGGVQTQRADYDGARASYTGAVELYARLLPCDGTRCDADELEIAHKNRISSALDAHAFDAARAALAEAKAVGLRFDDLEQRWPELRAP